MKCFSSHLAASGRLVRKIITSREPQTASCPLIPLHPVSMPATHERHLQNSQNPENWKLLCSHSKGKATEAERPRPKPQQQDSCGLHRQTPEPADQLLLGPFPTKLLLSCSHSGTLCFPPLNCAWALSLGQVQLLGMLTLTDRDILRGWH